MATRSRPSRKNPKAPRPATTTPASPTLDPVASPAPEPPGKSDRDLLREHLAPLVSAAEFPRVAAQIERYFGLLLSWNQRGNLISRGDESRVIEHHALDSLAVIPTLDEISPRSLLDLGSGGGLPGIPIKIVRPELAVTLLDSRRMKSLFLLHAVRELGLSGIRVWRRRAEELGGLPIGEGAPVMAHATPSVGDLEGPTHRPLFEAVIARAVASISKLAAWASPLTAPGGSLLAIKGGNVETEISNWKADPGPWELIEIRDDLRPRVQLVVFRRL